MPVIMVLFHISPYKLLLPLYMLLHYSRGKQTGIYFADSTKPAVCHSPHQPTTLSQQGFSEVRDCGRGEVQE